jgi:hypothetical protein
MPVVRTSETSLAPWAKLHFQMQFTPEFLVPAAQIVAQCLFLDAFHGHIMRVYSAARWSIVTSAFKREPNFVARCENRFP